jgi:hypothetical protein
MEILPARLAAGTRRAGDAPADPATPGMAMGAPTTRNSDGEIDDTVKNSEPAGNIVKSGEHRRPSKMARVHRSHNTGNSDTAPGLFNF